MTIYVKQSFATQSDRDTLAGMHPTLDIMQTVIEYDNLREKITRGTFDAARGDFLMPDTCQLSRTRYFARHLPESDGMTLAVRQESHYHDGLTDYSIVADIADDRGNVRTETISWAMDSGVGLTELTSYADADDCIRGLVEAVAQARAEQERRSRENATVYNIERGKLCIVRRGRKVPRGTSGRIVWFGQTQYADCVKIVTDDGQEFFTAANNVDIVPDPEV